VVIVVKPMQEIRLMRQACGADYRQHCSGTEIGGGGAVQCLVSHASSLSATCKGAVGAPGEKFLTEKGRGALRTGGGKENGAAEAIELAAPSCCLSTGPS